MPRVKVGLELLRERGRAFLGNQRVGLLCHQASVTADLEHATEVVRSIKGCTLAALFAPEHGLWGTAQAEARVAPRRDRATGLPVWSLYGRSRRPTPAMLRGLELLLCDLQDVGARYYTFVWTLALTMQACARAGVKLLVLDRPNPLGGLAVEGNVLEERFASFVGLHPLPVRHGMTIGELALYLNTRRRLGARLSVLPMRGWRRKMTWEATGLPWVPPSPNMPTPDTARVYPGGCLLEGTNLSEGRGTTRPFEWVGAPFIEPERWAAALRAEHLPGVHFRPCVFQPAFQKWKVRECGGVQLHVTDPERFKPYLTGLALIATARRLYPGAFAWRNPPYEFETKRLPIDLLLGSDRVRRQIERGFPLSEIEASWRGGLGAFRQARRKFLLYR